MARRVPTPVVVALLLNRQRVFMTRRGARGSLANAWEFPGGKVEYGEPPVRALRRELREELGVRPAHLVLFGAYSHVYNHPKGPVHYVLLAYRANVRDGPWAKHRRGRWMDLRALPDADIVEGSRPIISDLLEAGRRELPHFK